MSSEEQQNQDPNQSAGERKFRIDKIYVKDVSFEAPHSPQVFTQEWRPEVKLNLSTESGQIGEHAHNVTLSVTVTANLGNEAAFLIEVHQAGVFHMEGFPEEELRHMLGSFCPNVLFPYAREAVSDMVTRGGFPQLLLAPVNFDALFVRHMQEQAQREQASH
jgi:preprotein translocase subunit SecB